MARIRFIGFRYVEVFYRNSLYRGLAAPYSQNEISDLTSFHSINRLTLQGPCVQSERDLHRSQQWVLVCEQLLSRAIEHGTIFQLKQGEVALLCSVRRIPHFSITEEVIDPKLNKFVLRLQSETSV